VSSETDLFDDVARWQADAAEALGMQGVELVAALSPGPGFPGTLDALAERIVASGARDVVDLGAGLGGVSAWLAAATGATVVGVEPESGSREAAHLLFPGLDLRAGSAADSGLDAASADVVVAVGVTSLLDSLDGLLTEARRLLRPGGFLAIVDMFLANGDIEVDGPNTLRSTAALQRLVRDAGWERSDTDRQSDAAPDEEWVAAAVRLMHAVSDDHGGSPAVGAWIADRRKLAGWIESGHVVAGLVMLTPIEDAGPRRSADRLLRIYLQDHHATSSAGVRRVRRLADAEAGGPDGAVLDRLATEIAAERDVQARVMRVLGVQPQPAKEAVAKVAERAGLLKRNGRLVRRSPLTSLVELETMTIAARGKLAGWEALRAALGTDHVGGIDLAQLIAESEEHLAAFAGLHRRRAAEVLSVTTDPPTAPA